MALENVSSSDSPLNLGSGDGCLSDNDYKLHPHVLGIIMTYCDFNSLQNCRLVSQKWNIEALHILSKKICISIIIDQSKNYETQDKVNRLINCLENSKNPEKIFVHLSSYEWRGSSWPDYFILLLKKFGKYLKTFGTAYLIDCPLGSVTLELLMDWAVNLTSIFIKVIPNLNKQTNKDSNFGLMEFPQPLKLESIKLELDLDSCNSSEFPLSFSTNCQMWISSLLNSSPNLKCMNIPPNCSESTIIYKLISPFSNIFENLTEFEFEMVNKTGKYYDDAEIILSAMKNLKKLTLWDPDPAHTYYNAFCPPRRCFEGMKNSLKHLAFMNVFVLNSDDQPGLNCIEWFPNLEFFKIKIDDDTKNDDSFVYPFQGLTVPHKNLKKLLLLNVENKIINLQSIRVVVKSFPKVEVLHLGFEPYGEDILRVDGIILEVAQLLHLKELQVMTIMDNKMQFTRGMQSIKNYPSLQNLTIGLYNKSIRLEYLMGDIRDAQEFVDTLRQLSFTMDELKEPLLFAQGLQKLRLIGFNMEDENAVADFARENGIPMKMEELKGF